MQKYCAGAALSRLHNAACPLQASSIFLSFSSRAAFSRVFHSRGHRVDSRHHYLLLTTRMSILDPQPSDSWRQTSVFWGQDRQLGIRCTSCCAPDSFDASKESIQQRGGRGDPGAARMASHVRCLHMNSFQLGLDFFSDGVCDVCHPDTLVYPHLVQCFVNLSLVLVMRGDHSRKPIFRGSKIRLWRRRRVEQEGAGERGREAATLVASILPWVQPCLPFGP